MVADGNSIPSPPSVNKNNGIEARAVRYGWEESESVSGF